MKGYEYCQALFDEVFLPVLEVRFPDILPRLSVGVVGMGSDVLGADDKESRDHDWGPSRCQLLLPEPDVTKYGSSIAEALQAAVPDGFLGMSQAEIQPSAIRVSTIDTVYLDLCKATRPPETVEDWASADENDLCYASSGFVIYDPSGALEERISAFQSAYYPTDIWKWKLASALFEIWHHGEYNSSRLSRRGEAIGLLIGQGAFIKDTLRLLCLLNRRFPVYWKWLHWQVQSLPKWSDIFEPSLRELDSAANHGSRIEIIRAMCQNIREILHDAGLFPDSEWRTCMGGVAILQEIESPDVRELIRGQEPHLDVW